MCRRQLILDFSEYDLLHVVADLSEIRRYNPQRFEMEQITAIVLDDPKRGSLRRGSKLPTEFSTNYAFGAGNLRECPQDPDHLDHAARPLARRPPIRLPWRGDLAGGYHGGDA